MSDQKPELLRKLCEHQHEILTRKDLIDDLWEHENFFTSRSLDVFISRIRTYLKEDPQVRIINIRKAGYQFVIKKDESTFLLKIGGLTLVSLCFDSAVNYYRSRATTGFILFSRPLILKT